MLIFKTIVQVNKKYGHANFIIEKNIALQSNK